MVVVGQELIGTSQLVGEYIEPLCVSPGFIGE